jgi:hypothetical protein
MLSILAAPTGPPLLASYEGALTTSSQIFYRPQSLTNDYHYFQAIQVTVSVNGIYIFDSNSTADTRGYFYQNSFDPSVPTTNLVTDNDDGGGMLQFRIRVNLQAGTTYILVVTTHRQYVTGTFSVSAAGPSIATLTAITPSTSQPITTRKFFTSTFPTVRKSFPQFFLELVLT